MSPFSNRAAMMGSRSWRPVRFWTFCWRPRLPTSDRSFPSVATLTRNRSCLHGCVALEQGDRRFWESADEAPLSAHNSLPCKSTARKPAIGSGAIAVARTSGSTLNPNYARRATSLIVVDRASGVSTLSRILPAYRRYLER